jgi:hypothetical protein
MAATAPAATAFAGGAPRLQSVAPTTKPPATTTAAWAGATAPASTPATAATSRFGVSGHGPPEGHPTAGAARTAVSPTAPAAVARGRQA